MWSELVKRESIHSAIKHMKKLLKQKVAWLVIAIALLQAPAVLAGTVAAPAVKATAAKPGPRDIITEIIDVVGLKPRFEVREGDVDNAAAVIYNGQRYILYNRQFVAAVNNATKTDWAAVSILAHEIGHHLNGHTLSRSGSNPEDELEADEFSGFVLRKMGAGLADAQAAINLLSEERSSHTHPGRGYRLASISKGWNNADNQIIASVNSKPSNKPVAVRKSTPTVASAPARQTSSRVVLTQQDILRQVTFRMVPNETFYVTKNFNLIHVSDNGKVEMVGKMKQTNSRHYPFVLQSSYFDTMFIGNDGSLVSQEGERVGYLSS